MSLFEAFYAGGLYTQKNPGLNDGESARKADAFLQLARKCNLDLAHIASVIDVGCGAGGFLAGLIRQAPHLNRVTGIDLNPDAIEIANGRNLDGVDYLNCSLSEVEGEYDLATLVHVLEHIPEWENFLSLLANKAKIIYIGVPIEASVWMTLRKGVLVNQYLKYGHIHFFNEEFLTKMLNDLGFEIIGTGYSDEFLSFDSFSAKLIKIPRLILGMFSRKWACNLLGGYCYQVLCRPISSK